jgi:hypothetical protein
VVNFRDHLSSSRFGRAGWLGEGQVSAAPLVAVWVQSEVSQWAMAIGRFSSQIPSLRLPAR